MNASNAKIEIVTQIEKVAEMGIYVLLVHAQWRSLADSVIKIDVQMYLQTLPNLH